MLAVSTVCDMPLVLPAMLIVMDTMQSQPSHACPLAKSIQVRLKIGDIFPSRVPGLFSGLRFQFPM